MPTEYDYRFISERRDEIITVLKQRWVEKNQINLPVFRIDSTHLREFTTTERDVKRGTSRFPPV